MAEPTKQPDPKEQAEHAKVGTTGGGSDSNSPKGASGTAADALPSKGQADRAVREAAETARGDKH